VLLLEHDADAYAELLAFCKRLGLIALPCAAAHATEMLEQHKDLGGVLLADDLPCDEGTPIQLASTLHRLRPELPIFLRRSDTSALDESTIAVVAQAWPTGDLATLETAVERYLFSLRYPTVLVDGLVEMTQSSISAMFPNAELTNDPPYVVRDRIIMGQVSALIPLESQFCRGYMMLQCDERQLRQGLKQGFAYEGTGGDLGFRDLNQVLGELTNLVWGAFKNRYVHPTLTNSLQVQVPIVINHEQKYISFGAEDPQLCLRWHLTDPRRPGMPALTIVQRVIFNLYWSPDAFMEAAERPPESGAAGVLEFF
jgi:hypothetical protein